MASDWHPISLSRALALLDDFFSLFKTLPAIFCSKFYYTEPLPLACLYTNYLDENFVQTVASSFWFKNFGKL